MSKRKKCSECDNICEGKRTTCSDTCRSRRSRRLARVNRERNEKKAETLLPAEYAEAAEVVAPRGVTDVAHEVMKEELRPIVREAITSEVLSQVNRLVSLTPQAIDRLHRDMDHEDPHIAQRAYTLLLKYTMGNPSVAPPPAEQQPSPMQVHFHLPRPDDLPEDVAQEVLDVVALEEDRKCMECKEIKSEFVAGSDRCQDCHEALQERVRGMFG